GLGLLLSLLRPRSVFDAGCGDAGWLRQVDLGGDVEYMGADIVPDVVTANGEALGGPGRRFVCMDIVESAPAAHGLIVCLAVLSYLPNGDVLRALDGFRRSGSRWLLASTRPGSANPDITTGERRELALDRAPFRWTAPLLLVPG